MPTHILNLPSRAETLRTLCGLYTNKHEYRAEGVAAMPEDVNCAGCIRAAKIQYKRLQYWVRRLP